MECSIPPAGSAFCARLLSEIDSVSVDGESAKLRVLLLAPGCNPNGITGPLIGYSHAEALARLHAVTLVLHREDEEAVRPKAERFRAIEVVQNRWITRIERWIVRYLFGNSYRSQVVTALNYFFSI